MTTKNHKKRRETMIQKLMDKKKLTYKEAEREYIVWQRARASEGGQVERERTFSDPEKARQAANKKWDAYRKRQNK